MPAENPQEAADDYEDKTTAERWQQGIDNPRRSVSEGLADFWGGSANQYSDAQGRWDDGIEGKASTYEANTDGKGEVWQERADPDFWQTS